VVTDGGARRLLAVDVGNTNTVLGLYEGSDLLRHWRLTSRRDMTSDEIALSVEGLLRAVPGSRPPDDVIVATVVPSLRFPMRQAFRQLFDKDPVFVEPGIKTGMPILYESPSEVGADRIVNAVAAFAKVSGPCIVVDFGTATTFDVVTARGEYAGGVIVPGISISAEALFEKAARLWRGRGDRSDHAGDRRGRAAQAASHRDGRARRAVRGRLGAHRRGRPAADSDRPVADSRAEQSNPESRSRADPESESNSRVNRSPSPHAHDRGTHDRHGGG
jgi:pantothenate kinase type III